MPGPGKTFNGSNDPNDPDAIIGTDGDDQFNLFAGNDRGHGGEGNDTMRGGAGNDTLLGQGGDDVLIGEGGTDILLGGSGRDTFKFQFTSDSGVGSGNRDIINDFERGLDKIDLSVIDANLGAAGNQAFDFIGGAPFSGVAGQVRTAHTTTGNLVVLMDVNGDKKFDMQIEVQNDVTSLSVSDFVL